MDTSTTEKIKSLEKQIANLQKTADTSEFGLRSTSSFGGQAIPSLKQVSSQKELEALKTNIQNLTNEKLKAQWYPQKTKEAGMTDELSTRKPGILAKTFDFLSKPLYGVVGGVRHFTGQGTEGSLIGDIKENVQEGKRTFKDVLQQAGTPGMVAAPLGFTLDIAADPLNWITAGTTAVLPRLAVGLGKGIAGEGAIRGLSLAAKSSALEKATTIGRWTPGLSRAEGSAFSRLGGKAVKATSEWEKFAGTTAEEIVQKRGIGIGKYRTGIGEGLQKLGEKSPAFKSFLDATWYDPESWVRKTMIKDSFKKGLGVSVEEEKLINDALLRGENLADILSPSHPIGKTLKRSNLTPVEKTPFLPGSMASANVITPQEFSEQAAKLDHLTLKKVEDAADDVVIALDDTTTLLKKPELAETFNPQEFTDRISKEVGGQQVTWDDLEKVMKSGAIGESGIEWYDKMTSAIKGYKIQTGANSEKLQKAYDETIKSYDFAIRLFKMAKVVLSPTAWTNSAAGNTAMTHMMGFLDSTYLKHLTKSFNVYRGKSQSARYFDELTMLYDADTAARWKSAMTSPASRGTVGDVGSYLGPEYLAKRVADYAKNNGLKGVYSEADIQKGVRVEIEKLLEGARELGPESVGGGLSSIKDLTKGGKEVGKLDTYSGMISQEFYDSPAWTKKLEDLHFRATQPDAPAWTKAMDIVLNKMPSVYETNDQIFKFAAINHATIDGFTKSQIVKMRKFINIDPEDMTRIVKDGQTRYALSGEKALALANVTYLNYAAMPGAVHILRNLPLVGNPFASFAYGMSMKTGQTLAYNPAAFNKVTFAMKDFGGTKTPMEKQAIYDPKNTGYQFYSYLGDPGMYRMPFFDKNPIYMNLTQMLPYYSMNMFTPSNSNLGSGTPAAVIEAVQNNPYFFKDPFGVALFNNIVQPAILADNIAPQGGFGQPLYPVGATGAQRFGYAARDLGEVFMPGVVGYGGLASPTGDWLNYMPSYRWRTLAQAKEGKSQLGIAGKESPGSRTVRAVMGATGFPVQAPMNLQYGQE